jgi:hypothetical protein
VYFLLLEHRQNSEKIGDPKLSLQQPVLGDMEYLVNFGGLFAESRSKNFDRIFIRPYSRCVPVPYQFYGTGTIQRREFFHLNKYSIRYLK